MNLVKKIKNRVNTYYQSKYFEDDLDSVISALHVFSKGKSNFAELKSRADRADAKESFLLKQAMLACLAQAAFRGRIGVMMGNPALTLTLAAEGAGEAVVVILFIASGVVVKRMINGIEVESLEANGIF